jgi:hypothetical protein
MGEKLLHQVALLPVPPKFFDRQFIDRQFVNQQFVDF